MSGTFWGGSFGDTFLCFPSFFFGVGARPFGPEPNFAKIGPKGEAELLVG